MGLGERLTCYMSVDIQEGLILVLVLVGYAPVVRAYSRWDRTKWLFAGYTALVIGRVATIAEGFVAPTILDAVEHGVGIAIPGGLFAIYAYRYAEVIGRRETRDVPAGGGHDEGPEVAESVRT